MTFGNVTFIFREFNDYVSVYDFISFGTGNVRGKSNWDVYDGFRHGHFYTDIARLHAFVYKL